MQHVRTMDVPRRSYASVKYEPAGIRKPRRLLESSWKHYYYYYFYYYLGVDGWIILGWISRRWDVGMWTGLGWPRTGTGGGRL